MHINMQKFLPSILHAFLYNWFQSSGHRIEIQHFFPLTDTVTEEFPAIISHCGAEDCCLRAAKIKSSHHLIHCEYMLGQCAQFGMVTVEAIRIPYTQLSRLRINANRNLFGQAKHLSLTGRKGKIKAAFVFAHFYRFHLNRCIITHYLLGGSQRRIGIDQRVRAAFSVAD